MDGPTRRMIASRRLPVLRPKFAAFVLLGLSLVIYSATVIRVPLAETFFFNLSPQPDAEEYVAGAVSLAREGTFHLHYAGRDIPSRYPFGYSALMVPWIVGGGEPILAPFVVNQVIGAFILIGVFTGLWRAGYRLAAGLSSLLMATLPCFVIGARAPMSDLSAAAVALLSWWCFYRFVRDQRLSAGILGSLLLGMGTWLRIANVMFAPVAAVSVFLGFRGTWRRKVVLTAALYAAFLAGAAPLLAYNAATFGSPLATGYPVWAPGSTPTGAFFALVDLRKNVEYLWREFAQTEKKYTLAFMYGDGSDIGPAFVILVVLGAVLSARRRMFWILALPVLLFLGLMTSFWASGVRLMLPAVLIAVPMVAVAASNMIGGALERRTRTSGPAAVVTLLLLASAVMGIPGNRPYPELVGLFRVDKFGRAATRYEIVQQLERRTGTKRKLILTDLNPSYVDALMSGDRLVSPLEPTDIFAPALFTEDDRRKQITAALAQNASVFGLVARGNLSDINRQCPEPIGYRWQPLFRHRGGGGIAVLARARSN